MRSRFCLLLLLCSALAAQADELTKSVQSSLKEQGFFYGEATGVNGPETAAAVKRYQIRNGLEVTGTLTKETLSALNVSGDGAPPLEVPNPPAPTQVKPATKPAAPVERSQPPVNIRKAPTQREDDREFLQRQKPSAPPAEVDEPPISRRPPAPTAPRGPYGRVFSGTPYASAPGEVQQDTIRRAQRFLHDLDFYHESLDGRPSPALEEGILSYQKFIALPLSGQLDMETLAAMRLLPGGRGSSPSRSANPQVRRVPGQPLKGVWVQ